MTTDHLTGYPTGGPEQWRQRYEPVLEKELGAPIPDAAVTAVVVTWAGGAAFVGDSLKAIAAAADHCDEVVEVIVVDNHGPEELAERYEEHWDQWLRFESNLGLSPARNLGVVSASADLIAFIDDDGLVAPDYFSAALPYFEDDEVVAIRGRVVAKEHPYFTTLATHYDRGPEPVEDALVTEGASFIRQNVFVDAGGFPDELSGHEGIALSYRMQKSVDDGKTLYVPDVVLHHDYLDSWDAFWTKVTGYAQSEDELEQFTPDVARFMNEYFAKSFPRKKLTVKEELARTGLRALRTAIKGGLWVTRGVRRTVDNDS